MCSGIASLIRAWKHTGKCETTLRRVNLWFGIIFGVEVLLIIGAVFYIPHIVHDETRLTDILSSMLVSFGSLLITTALVYHNFWLHPDLKMMNITVEPLDPNLRNIAEAKYKSPVFERIPEGIAHKPDKTIPRVENGYEVVESNSPFSIMRISTDVCNVGGSETTIHEYKVEQLKPIQKVLGTYIFRRSLPNEKRETIDFLYAKPASGEYKFEFSVVASTAKVSRRFTVIVSDDVKTVKWRDP